MLNHFNCKKVDNSTVLVTNDLGKYAFLKNNEFRSFLTSRISQDSELHCRLRDLGFIIEPSDIYSDQLTSQLRDMKSYLFSSTSLHIFVITNACNLNCVYCQAQSHNAGFMTKETARRSVDIAVQSPSNSLSFEFQGGEPLMNFPIIKEIYEYSQEVKGEKKIEYTVVSNLSLLTEEMLAFFNEHGITICTSVDGPRDLHNSNRPHLNGISSFDKMSSGLSMLKEKGIQPSAIQTTTRQSLRYPKEIVRTYHDLGMSGLFIRPLTPLGFAHDRWKAIGYTAGEFISFYREAFDEILRINKEDSCFVEQHALIFLKKILGGYSTNYMELRSPCGAGVGQMAYYYDGNVYTCDEARMVAEAGDELFRMGDVYHDDYQSLVSSSPCKVVCGASIIESLPVCSDCVYQPYCGVCPVINYALDNNIFTKGVKTYRCEVYKGILDCIFEKLRGSEEAKTIMESWLC